jgi:hypothetical protein
MKLSTLMLGVCLVSAISSAASITINDNGSDVYFQENPQAPGNAVRTLGQTFSVPTPGTDDVLTDFTFYFKNANANFDYRAYVYQWDTVNLKATGPALYTSSAQNGSQAPTFTGLSIILDPGTTYIAFLTTEGVVNNGYSDSHLLNNSGNVYTGGAAYQQTSSTSHNSSGVGSWDSSAWSALNGDFKFNANFSSDSVSTSATPEPASATMMLVSGLALLGLSRVRSNQAAKSNR